MTKLLRAKFVVPMDAAPMENGAVLVRGNRIEEVGRFDALKRLHGAGAEVIDLGEQALLPGLINAHCHLDYTLLRNSILPPASFSDWIKRINGVKRSYYAEDYLRSVQLGFAEARKWGTTSLVNIESFPGILPHLERPPLRTWWFFELIDIRQPIESLDFGQLPEGWLGGFGLSPHAPYTASMDVYQRAAATGQLITTHINESDDEARMFHEATGGLYELLVQAGRDMSDCGSGSPLQWLAKHGLIDSRWIIAHLNELDETDFRILAERKPHIAHCPCSHRYFKHRRFEFTKLRQLGLNICLGTDSLASNDFLDLFAEMRALQANEPGLSAEEIIQTVTRNPAIALGCGDTLGRITPGALADLICVPIGSIGSTGPLDRADRGDRADLNSSEIYEQIVQYRKPVQWMMVDGQVLEREPQREPDREPHREQ